MQLKEFVNFCFIKYFAWKYILMLFFIDFSGRTNLSMWFKVVLWFKHISMELFSGLNLLYDISKLFI